jgi:hypothetical protein
MHPDQLRLFWSEHLWAVVSQSRLKTAFGSALFMLCTHCAVYDDAVDASTALTSETAGGSVGGSTAGSGSFVAGSFAADGDRFYGGGGTYAGSGIGDAPQGGSSATTGGSVGTSTGGAGEIAGGVSSAGTSAGAGDSAGQPGEAPSVTDYNLSRGKPTTTDSEQSHLSHYASDGNDGDPRTRWCATNGRANHYWEVDLGSSFNLSALRILWEKNAAYLFRVESSVDHTSWSVALDKTASSATASDQHYQLPPDTTGRYVRLTVTGGLSTNVWASFYELEVFGH